MKKKIKFGDITIREALNVCSDMVSCSECPFGFEVAEDKTTFCRLINTFNHEDSKYLEDEIEIEENENDQN